MLQRGNRWIETVTSNKARIIKRESSLSTIVLSKLSIFWLPDRIVSELEISIMQSMKKNALIFG